VTKAQSLRVDFNKAVSRLDEALALAQRLDCARFRKLGRVLIILLDFYTDQMVERGSAH